MGKKRKRRPMSDQEAREHLLKTDENARRLYERIQYYRRKRGWPPLSY
jgi:hypothetical protein